jgi:hypothetical protein
MAHDAVRAPAAAAALEDTRRIWSWIMAQVCDICGKGPHYAAALEREPAGSEGDRKWRTQEAARVRELHQGRQGCEGVTPAQSAR